MKLKKIAMLGMTLALSIGALAACGSGKNGGGESQKAADSANSSGDSSEKVKIRLLTRMAGTSDIVKIYNGIIDEFKAKHPEVEIIDDSQGDESAFNNILSTDMASGKMANIYRVQGVANLQKYIDNGFLLDVTPYLEADPEWGKSFAPGALSYYSVPGKEGTYAIPMESGLIGVYYHEDRLKEAGVEKFPETWDELLAAIDKLNANGVTPIALGESSNYMGGHLHDQIFYKWLGTEAAKELGNRSKKWTDPDVVQTLQYIKD